MGGEKMQGIPKIIHCCLATGKSLKLLRNVLKRGAFLCRNIES